VAVTWKTERQKRAGQQREREIEADDHSDREITRLAEMSRRALLGRRTGYRTGRRDLAVALDRERFAAAITRVPDQAKQLKSNLRFRRTTVGTGNRVRW
jgi:hypothetical protein